MSDILHGLNPAQREAVIHYDQPSLIIAGAGSGKTRVLTTRIAYMIEQGVDPHAILALTFTNKAAAEMRSRIEAMLPGGRARAIRMGTFHSVFSRILHAEAERIGFPPTFTIYEPSDTRNLLKSLVREMDMSEETYKPQLLASRISAAKNNLVTPASYAANAMLVAEDHGLRIPRFADLYARYAERCRRNGAMDFDDLLLQINLLFRDCGDVLARYQQLFRYILVDEYQDTNYAQYVIVRRLAEHHARVCVVGDDAQSIYSFRGAKIENILSFRRDFPDAETFKLEQNYRSTRTIVEAANSLIAHNARRMEKACFSEGPQGEKIRVLRAYTDREEAEQVVDHLRRTVREAGDAWSAAALLYRTNAQSLVIEEALRRRGIPYRIYKGNSFYDHKEIKDLIAYIRLVVNPLDDEAFRRIVNVPARGIGEQTVARLDAYARTQGVSLWEAADTLVDRPDPDSELRPVVRKVSSFVAMIRALGAARTAMGLYEIGLEIATRSGLVAHYRADASPESASALDNIEELLNTMQLFREQREAELRSGESEAGEATLDEWLQGVMLLTDMDRSGEDDADKVTLMTIHSAKGLEFRYVYIVGIEDDLFPSPRAAESPEGLEEERRLFYVALTRAKQLATLSYSESRFKWGNMEFCRPSRFLGEIDPRYLDVPFDGPEGRAAGREEGTAIEQLRRRFDYRMQRGREGLGSGARPASASEYRPVSASGPRPASASGGGASSPSTVSPIAPSRSLRPVAGAHPAPSGSAPSAAAGPLLRSGFTAGMRVAHAKFGAGTVEQVEHTSLDEKLVVRFDDSAVGRKTLLAKFARLTACK